MSASEVTKSSWSALGDELSVFKTHRIGLLFSLRLMLADSNKGKSPTTKQTTSHNIEGGTCLQTRLQVPHRHKT